MCTLSWCFSKSGYHLVFNRDEQKSRELAQVPQYFDYGNGLKALMPIDPKGKGTWVSVNNRGLTLALLNFYQGQVPAGELLSRGQIVRRAAGMARGQQIEAFLHSLKLCRYPPFSLLVFDRAEAEATCFLWSGERFSVSVAQSPHMSSSVEFDQVCHARQAQYQARVKLPQRLEDLLPFHTSHSPRPSAFSVCMHRADAQTVSQTQISVEDNVSMNYLPGAPCETRCRQIRRYCFPLLSQ